MNDIKNSVQAILAEHLGPGWMIKSEDRLQADLGLDSLDAVELANQVEVHFHIQVPTEVIPTWLTVGDVVRYIADHSE